MVEGVEQEQATAAGAPPPEVSQDVRERLALALDVDDLIAGIRLARELRPWFGVAKVGLELFSAAGPDAVVELVEAGYRVFLDVKLHDIPTTVHRAARVLGGLGASYLTLHTAGGIDMLRAGVEGLRLGADAAGLPGPAGLGVTILTSDTTADPGELRRRVLLAGEAGCGGVVCATPDLEAVRAAGPDLLAVVPGIRLSGSPADDQARVAGPGQAITAGAGLLVVGRTVTGAPDRMAAAAQVAADVAAALT